MKQKTNEKPTAGECCDTCAKLFGVIGCRGKSSCHCHSIESRTNDIRENQKSMNHGLIYSPQENPYVSGARGILEMNDNRAQEKPEQFPEHICRFNDAPQVCECYAKGKLAALPTDKDSIAELWYEKGKAEPHNTADGYCCACDYDQARFEQKLNANHNGK